MPTCVRQLGFLPSDWSSRRPMGELGILRLRLSQAPAAGGDRGILTPGCLGRRSENDGTLLIKLLHTFNHGELMKKITLNDVF